MKKNKGLIIFTGIVICAIALFFLFMALTWSSKVVDHPPVGIL